MPKLKLKSFFLILGFLTSFSLFPTKAIADYDFDVISDVWSTETNDATFEFSADEDELSCSAGGGSTPSMWVGSMTGNGGTSVNDYDGTDKTDDFFTGGVGFNIPLGRKANYNNCDRVLAIVEAEKFIQMISSLKDLGVIDDEKVKQVVNNYLITTENKLGIDLLSSINSK